MSFPTCPTGIKLKPTETAVCNIFTLMLHGSLMTRDVYDAVRASVCVLREVHSDGPTVAWAAWKEAIMATGARGHCRKLLGGFRTHLAQHRTLNRCLLSSWTFVLLVIWARLAAWHLPSADDVRTRTPLDCPLYIMYPMP